MDQRVTLHIENSHIENSLCRRTPVLATAFALAGLLISSYASSEAAPQEPGSLTWHLRNGRELPGLATASPKLTLDPVDPKAEKRDEQAGGRPTCRIIATEILCSVPTGRWDVKLSLEGYAPLYHWDVSVAAGKVVELGEARLIPGASVTGWLIVPPRNEPAVAAEASSLMPDLVLEKQLLGWIGDPRERQKMDQLAYRVKPADTGFFQLSGVAAGAFSLQADLLDQGKVELAQVELEPGEEKSFDQPIEIQLPERLRVFVAPPSDEKQLPWQVKVAKVVAKRYDRELVDEGTVDEGGGWTSRPLMPGFYELEVTSSGKNSWHKQTIELTSSPPIIQIDLQLIRIEGQLRLGDDPLAADLIFGSFHGRPQIWMRADEEGEFTGVLPKAGEWRLDVLLGPEELRQLDPVEIAADEDPARIEVVLPGNVIAGKVTRYGAPVPEAFVTVFTQDEDPKEIAHSLTSASGEFTLKAVRPGAVAVSATDLRISSGWSFVQLNDDTEIRDLHLELVAQRTVRGQVVAWPGGGLPAVEITAESGLPTFRRRPTRALSTVDGSFELTVPEDEQVLDLVLVAPGFGVQLQRLMLPEADDEAPTTDVELPPITLHRERVAVKLPDEGTWFLASQGSMVAVPSLLSLFYRLELLQSTSTGWWLAGLAPMGYSFCQGPAGPCIDAVETAEPGGRELEQALPSPH